MSKTRRTLGLAILGLIGIGALVIALENVRGKRAVQRYKARLVAQGEKLSIEELTPALSVSGRNAENDLIQAGWQLAGGSVVPANPPPLMRMIRPGKPAAAWAQPDIQDPGRLTNTWETLATDLQRNTKALQSIREILKSPALDAGLNYQQGFNLMLPHLARLKGIAQWLAAATIYELHNGNLNQALADLDALIALSRVFSDERLMISQLVRIAIAAIAFGPTWEALQASGWTDEQLARLQSDWESIQFMGSMEHAIEMERAMGLDAFARLRKSSAERKQMFGGAAFMGGTTPPGLAAPNSASDIPEFASQLGEKTLSAVQQIGAEQSWLWLWSYRDELRYLEVLQMTLEVARRSGASRSFVGVYTNNSARLDQMWRTAGASPAYFLSRTLSASLHKASAKAARMEMQRELAIAAIALKRYQLRRGNPAPNLAALVPEFLAKPPIDFMDGRELRYQPNPDGSFLLYSINEDGRDDGGDPRPVNEKSSGRFPAMGRDFVWPMPATAEEVVAAETQAKKR